MNDSRNTDQLGDGTRAILNAKDPHAHNGQSCTIIGALHNPSGRAENQWYDVQFDDDTVARFLGKYLTPGNKDAA